MTKFKIFSYASTSKISPPATKSIYLFPDEKKKVIDQLVIANELYGNKKHNNCKSFSSLDVFELYWISLISSKELSDSWIQTVL